jgi:hypothetical protein
MGRAGGSEAGDKERRTNPAATFKLSRRAEPGALLAALPTRLAIFRVVRTWLPGPGDGGGAFTLPGLGADLG